MTKSYFGSWARVVLRPVVPVVTVVFFAAACYEIPPYVDQGFFEDAVVESAGTPPKAYTSLPFDARNRWFERAFSRTVAAVPGPEEEGGEFRPARFATATPLASSERYNEVDCAEIVALLEEVLRTDNSSATSCRDGVARTLFHTDLLALAAGMRAPRGASRPSPGGASGLYVQAQQSVLQAAQLAARRRGGQSCVPPAPPFASGEWCDAANGDGLRLPDGFLPSARDLRWTQVLSRRPTAERPRASALVRLRVALGPDGESEMLPIASEVWLLEEESPRRAEVWRFDRMRWIEGGDPWRAYEGDDQISILDPRVSSRRWLTGTVAALCGGCHGEEEQNEVEMVSADVDEQRRRIDATLSSLWEN
ncbi:MAG: hypothetical protein MK538_18120 [Planctomycetes bacterium]|nr:hypothetical protein [Planctomycetota bacterium]